MDATEILNRLSEVKAHLTDLPSKQHAAAYYGLKIAIERVKTNKVNLRRAPDKIMLDLFKMALKFSSEATFDSGTIEKYGKNFPDSTKQSARECLQYAFAEELPALMA